MPEADRQKWDQRYREGAYAQRDHASAYLIAQQALLNKLFAGDRVLRAADLACGRGRNARWLAAQGYAVDGYDISPVGLAAAAAASVPQQETPNKAPAAAREVSWLERDLLQDGLPADTRYDVMLIVRFVPGDCLQSLLSHLQPGGVVIMEQHLRWHGPETIVGPGSERFRMAPGALVQAVQKDAVQKEAVQKETMQKEAPQAYALRVLHAEEGLVHEPDGSLAALTRITAQKTV